MPEYLRHHAAKAATAVAHAAWSAPALWAFLASYLVFAAVTWLVYLRGQTAEAPVVVAVPA